MTSKLKSETARINGAKSKGPKSPETRAKSARNAVTHGLTAVSTIILDCESEDEFNELLGGFTAAHLPVGAAEQDTVEQMTVARWRVRRISTAETALVDVEIARRKPETDKEFPGADPGVHLALALKALSDDSRSFALFSRYKSREERTYDRAYRTLREMQAVRKAQGPSQPEAAPAPPPDEPKSEIHNPAPATEPTPTSEIRHLKSSLHSKSLKSGRLPMARVTHEELRKEPTAHLLRRRFRARHSLLARSAAKNCRR